MKNKLIYFIFGLLSSTLIFIIYNYFNGKNSIKNSPYFVLNKDYNVGELGILKKGTKLKFDKGMSEGFSRFILYLNIKGGDISKELETDVIIPYWLIEVNPKDSINSIKATQ